MNAFIVWDHSRKEHGEPAELLDMFLSREDAVTFIVEDVVYGFDESDVTIEERKLKGSLSEEVVKALCRQVVAEAQSGMRVVIGDRTPRQYDRADQMATYISLAVERALTKLGYVKDPDEPEAETA